MLFALLPLVSAYEIARIHPHELSYFNAIAGGPERGRFILSDSNVDWGQDFDALAAALPRLGIAEVTTDISSERRLRVPGVLAVAHPGRASRVPAEVPPNRRLHDARGGYAPVFTRYVAVSVSRLLGLYSQNDMSWLRTRRLMARINDSIFLFDMDTPADRPLDDFRHLFPIRRIEAGREADVVKQAVAIIEPEQKRADDLLAFPVVKSRPPRNRPCAGI